MHTAFRIREFIKYLFTAQSEYKIHSPFAFDFYTKVIRSKQNFPEELFKIEKIRKTCLQSDAIISVNDFGTGAENKTIERKISEIMSRYSNSKKDTFLLYRIVRFLKPSQILELGTSLGISTMYMSMANTGIPVTTIEACPQTAAKAQNNFKELSLNINLINGNFDDVLSEVLKEIGTPGFVFFDGNHTKEATLRYFNECLQFAGEKSVFVFDDIYWSPGMKDAWNIISADPQVRLSIDLYRLGIVFFDKKIAKQHFVLKY